MGASIKVITMKAKEVPPGHVFKYADTVGNSLTAQTQFIRLHHEKVVNVATWTAAKVDEDVEVVILGTLKLVKPS